MRRTTTWLTAAAALLLALGACGDDGGDKGDEAATGCQPADSSITVGALDKVAFDADSYDAEAGCVEVTYVNEGSLAHTLLVKDLDGFKLAVGDEDVGTLELEPGDYTLFCDIPGHEAAGMEATLTVE
jgi:plastocyanin